jgi:hypothetical protein
MSHWDVIGYFAAGMVFVAFGMKEMVPLRVVAMLSNLAFVTYGLGLDLAPVWLLHAVLLPLNGWRLVQALRFAGRRIRIDLDAGESGLAARKLHRSIAVQREARTTGGRGESADKQVQSRIAATLVHEAAREPHVHPLTHDLVRRAKAGPVRLNCRRRSARL